MKLRMSSSLYHDVWWFIFYESFLKLASSLKILFISRILEWYRNLSISFSATFSKLVLEMLSFQIYELITLK